MILRQCIASFVTRETLDLLDLYDLWKDFGQFPNGRCLLDQSAQLVDAFRVFEAEMAAVVGPQRALTQMELVEVLSSAFGGKRR